MWTDRLQDARHGRAESLLVVFLVLFFLILGKVAIFADLALFVFFLLFIFGNDVQVNGMGLRHFELGFTLRATQDLALFDFIFVNIDLCGTFRAADHGSILRTVSRKGWRRQDREHHRGAYYITRNMKSTPPGRNCSRLRPATARV